MAKKDIHINHPEFTLLITGSADNDPAAERIAASGVHIVHHKFAYAAPFERFEELRKLQLKVRRSPCSVGKKICTALDLSEWIGHEDEDYFIISAKYFHDHCDRMGFIFTVGECGAAEVQKMYLKLRMYMHGTLKVDETFLKQEALTAYIASESADKDAASLLAQVLMTEPMRPFRTYPTVRNICSDITDMSGSARIRLGDVIKYLRAENSLPHLISKNLSLRFAEDAEEKIKTHSSHTAA